MKARCPLRINVTAALLDTLSDMQRQMARLVAELDAETFRRRVDAMRASQVAPDQDGTDSFALHPDLATNDKGQKGVDGARETGMGPPSGEGDHISRYRHREVIQYHDVFRVAWPVDESAPDLEPGDHESASGGGGEGQLGLVNTMRFPVCHEFSASLPLESRMSFTILNLTGQRTRHFQPRAGEDTRRLQYLRVSKGLYSACAVVVSPIIRVSQPTRAFRHVDVRVEVGVRKE